MASHFKIDNSKSDKKDRLHINFDKKEITGNITVMNFVDHNHHICYIPTLKISSYGDTKKEALDRLIHEVIDDYFDNLFSLNKEQLDSELRRNGWLKNKLFSKRFLSKSFVDKDGILKDFNLPKETKIETTVLAA
jgi:hypothetical protein